MSQACVLVIGAGFAGLSAAKTLTAQSECQVIVLEAGSCVGGRARGGQLPSGTQVELGATWFHGVRDNPVYDMAVWQGVVKDIRCDPEHQKHDSDWQLHFARPLETTLLSGELNAVAMEAVGRYTEAAEECTQGAQLGDGSVGDVLRRTYDEAVASEKLEGAGLQIFADAWHFREKLQRTFDGFYSTDDVSLAFAREYETLEGPNMPVPGGYQGLAEILAQGLDIRFNHQVSRISYGPSGATVTCENGIIFEAQHVLVTTSLGVLQSQHQKLFDPPLPQWKLDAMAAVRIGVADKLFVEFDIKPQQARDAAVWLTSHANLALTPSPSSTSGSYAVAGTQHLSPQPASHSLVHNSVSAGSASDTAYTEQFRSRSSPGHNLLSPEASPACLPEGVIAALPPESTGGLPEPFNLGRRPIPQLWSPDTISGAPGLLSVSEDSSNSGHTVLNMGGPAVLYTAAAAAAAAAAALAQSTQGPERPSATSRGRRRKHKRTIHSYAFLWPVSRPLALGGQGHPAMLPTPINALTTPICLDPLDPPPPAFHVPSWLQGLHSIRYCPGPEWVEPSLLQEAMGGSDGSRGKRTLADAGRRSPGVNLLDGGATHVSGVLWITGDCALEMEKATEEEVTQGVATLFKLFPQVPIPPGAIMPPRIVRTNWGTDPNFMGSYSYVNVTEETGDVVDAIAEPLCNDEGVPIVLFAGEATYRQYIGTIHGAFLSGCREAERLLEMMRPMPAGQTTSSSAVHCSPTRTMGGPGSAEAASAHLTGMGSLHV